MDQEEEGVRALLDSFSLRLKGRGLRVRVMIIIHIHRCNMYSPAVLDQGAECIIVTETDDRLGQSQ